MEYTEEYIDLRQYWLILRRRWVPAVMVMGSVTLLTAVLTFLQKPVYEASGEVLLKKEAGVSSLSEDSALGALEALTQQSSPLSTEAEIIRSEPVVRQAIGSLRLLNSEGEPLEVKGFLENLTVTNTKDTDILRILYQSTDPEEAAVVVNKLIEIYQAKNLESNRLQAKSARQFVESQLPSAEQEVQRLELAMRQFKERSNVVSLPEEARVAVQGVGELQKLLTESQAKLADMQTQAQALRNELGVTPKEGLAVNALSQSPAVQKALTELQDVQRTLATARTQFQPDHPTILDLASREVALQSFLVSQVGQVIGSTNPPTSLGSLQASQSQQTLTEALVQTEVQRLGLTNQVNELLQTQSAYQQRLSTMPRLEQLQRELERKLTVAQSTYEALLKSWQEFRIAENQNVGNTEIVAPSTIPEKPISPKVLLNLAIGVVMGTLLGVGTALLLEALDTSVKTVKEAQELFDLTVLGTIPTLEGSEKVSRRVLDRKTPQLPVRDSPRSAVSEAYRMLQANLKFLSSDQPTRVMVMTSSVPQEGKSTTAANLALVFAEMGYRVLVVDADLRRPSQHQIWELPNAVGLSNILVDTGGWSGVVRSENENLDIITAGVIPPNPLRIVDSQRMATLIQEWRETYDFVLIDSPPLAVAAEALVLAQMTDGALMVARPGVLTSESAETARAAITKANVNNPESRRSNMLGLVLNGVIPQNEPDSYYYYYAKDYYAAEPGDLQTNETNKNGKLLGDVLAPDQDIESSIRK